MKVKDLIKLLSTLNPETILICQKDAEGNGFSPLSAVESAFYKADCTWGGQISYEDGEDGEDGVDEGASPCIILVPIN